MIPCYACRKCGKKSEWVVLLCPCYSNSTQEEIDNFNRVHQEFDEADRGVTHVEERERRKQWLIDHTGDGRGSM